MASLKRAFVGTLMLALLAGCGSNNLPVLDPNLTVAPVENQQVEINNYRYKLIEITGIGPVYEKKLNETIGIKYTDELLKAGAKRLERGKLAEKTGISEKLILRWVNHIDLMRLKGIGPKQSNWLEAVGVDSIPELAQRTAANLHERLEIANNIDPNRKFVDRMVSVTTVQSWIDSAKKTVPMVEVTH